MSRKSSTQRKKQRVAEHSTMIKANLIECYNEEQEEALRTIRNNTITFLIGTAGTGKTHVAIAYAVCEFLDNRYQKIIMTRPAVEAGERLGYLPGDFEEKIHPYMIPLLDFLEEKLDKRFIKNCFTEGHFEIAPLAYMRGRTLKDSIIILDEAQNAKTDQVLMLLTRIGRGSKIIVTGDPSQSDLNGKGKIKQISEALSAIDSIDYIELTESVRHPLITEIVKAFKEIM